MNHKEKAVNYFSQKLHCSQSVLAAFADECGITEEEAFRLGSCFGSGMRKGEVCGAVTGALMVLGLLYGQKAAGDIEGRQFSNKVNDLMMDCFKEKCGKNAALTSVMIYWAAMCLQKKAFNIAAIINSSQSSAQRWLLPLLK